MVVQRYYKEKYKIQNIYEAQMYIGWNVVIQTMHLGVLSRTMEREVEHKNPKL